MDVVSFANKLLSNMKPADCPDVCCWCGEPGADKIPAPVQWPEQDAATTEYVHSHCEDSEIGRASALCTGKERDDWIDRFSGA